MAKLTKKEIEWLKGFTPRELEKYLKDFPERAETTKAFRRKFIWIRAKWREVQTNERP